MLLEVELFKVFALVLARFSGLIVSAPLLGSRNFPVQGKIGMAAMVALILTPSVASHSAALPITPVHFASFAVGEVAIGLLMGFVMTLTFAAIQVGGQIMDMQTGFGMMNVFNPAFETQFPIFGFYFFIIAVLYLLSLNGHHMMIRAMVSTFDKIPLGGFVYRPRLMLELSNLGSAMFLDGLKIAAPVVGAMMLAYASMGLAARVVPQIHLFAVGFPITIAIGLLVVAFSTAIYINILDKMFAQMFNNVAMLIRGMA